MHLYELHTFIASEVRSALPSLIFLIGFVINTLPIKKSFDVITY